MKVTTSGLGILFVALLATALPVAAACSNAPLTNRIDGDAGDSWSDPSGKKLVLYLEAGSASTDPFLSPDRDAGTAAFYSPASAGPTSGATAWAAYAQGQTLAPIEFRLEAAPQDYFFNLTRSIFMDLHWTNVISVADSPTATKGGGTLRVEFYTTDLDGKEVLIGGDQETSGFRGGANPQKISTPAETAMVHEGHPFIVRIYRTTGYADLGIGTGDEAQSLVEFGYYDVDPLASAFYLDPYKKSESYPENPEVGAVAAAGAAALVVPRRNRRAIPAALLVMVAASGCFGGDPAGPAGTTGPTGVVQVGERDGLNDSRPGTGAIEGRIFDNETGLPLGGAHVALVGTNLFVDSNEVGRFAIANVTPKTYRIHVGAVRYVGIQQTVQVQAGKAVQLDVRLDPSNAGGNDRPHRHDDWMGKTELPLYDGPGFVGPLPNNKLVLPGAVRLEIVWTWTPAAGEDTERAAYLETPAYTWACFLPRASGVPVNFAFFPNEADSGHAKSSEWTFELPGDNVKITIFKGVVPFEPAHRDFWAGRDTIEMLMNAAPFYEGGSNEPPRDHPNYQGYWGHHFSHPEFFVPPGTAEIRGRFSWTNPTLDTASSVPQTDWKLLYKGADIPYHPSGDPHKTPGYKPVPLTPAGARTCEFVLLPTAQELDQFYQTKSLWSFVVDDGQEPLPLPAPGDTYGANTHTGTKWRLSVTLYKDPAWSDV